MTVTYVYVKSQKETKERGGERKDRYLVTDK